MGRGPVGGRALSREENEEDFAFSSKGKELARYTTWLDPCLHVVRENNIKGDCGPVSWGLDSGLTLSCRRRRVGPRTERGICWSFRAAFFDPLCFNVHLHKPGTLALHSVSTYAQCLLEIQRRRTMGMSSKRPGKAGVSLPPAETFSVQGEGFLVMIYDAVFLRKD